VKRLHVALAVSLVLAGALAPAAAQGRYVRLDGWVQWIAADKMMLVPDIGPSVAIDLTRVPLAQYRALTQRDRVVVIGVVSRDNRQVFATTVSRAYTSGEEAP